MQNRFKIFSIQFECWLPQSRSANNFILVTIVKHSFNLKCSENLKIIINFIWKTLVICFVINVENCTVHSTKGQVWAVRITSMSNWAYRNLCIATSQLQGFTLECESSYIERWNVRKCLAYWRTIMAYTQNIVDPVMGT